MKMPEQNHQENTPQPVDIPALEKHNDAILSDLREIIATSEKYTDRFIHYFERLLLLDGGTIALTFTLIAALHSFRGGQVGLQCVPFIIWAWYLLLASMGCCLYCQVAGSRVSADNILLFHTKLMTVNIARAKRLIANLREVQPVFEESTRQIEALDKPKKRAILQGAARASAVIALLSTATAFLLLVLFAQANLRMLTDH